MQVLISRFGANGGSIKWEKRQAHPLYFLYWVKTTALTQNSTENWKWLWYNRVRFTWMGEGGRECVSWLIPTLHHLPRLFTGEDNPGWAEDGQDEVAQGKEGISIRSQLSCSLLRPHTFWKVLEKLCCCHGLYDQRTIFIQGKGERSDLLARVTKGELHRKKKKKKKKCCLKEWVHGSSPFMGENQALKDAYSGHPGMYKWMRRRLGLSSRRHRWDTKILV